MQARLSAFLVWAIVAAGVVFWGLRLMARPAPLPAHLQAVDVRAAAGGDFARLFGAAPVAESTAPVVAVAESSRFKLFGVLAPVARDAAHSPSDGGVALIAVDGKPARAYRIGAALDDGLVLQSVERRSASIGPPGGAPSTVLELPPPAPPATGTLPVASAEPVPVASMPPPAAPQAVVEDADSGAPAPPVPPAPRGEEHRNPVLR